MQESHIDYIVVEDNRIDELSLLAHAQKHSQLSHKATARSYNDAQKAVAEYKPHLIFLDIDIPMGSGLDVARFLKNNDIMIVFVTSHSEYALEGFDLNALDYLVKPLSPERFEETWRRIEYFWQMKQKALCYEAALEKEELIIKVGYNNRIKLMLSEILYLEAMQDYTKVVTTDKKHLVNIPLSGFMKQLPEGRFFRIHRSYAVPVDGIKEVGSNNLICNKISFPIGKTYRTILKNFKG